MGILLLYQLNHVLYLSVLIKSETMIIILDDLFYICLDISHLNI